MTEPNPSDASATADGATSGDRVYSPSHAEAMATDLFSKIASLLESELQAGSDDFTLLEQMNLVTTAKYREMAQYTSGLVAILDKLREKKAELQPSLDAIDRVDTSVTELERVAAYLDQYTRQLEAKLQRAL